MRGLEDSDRDRIGCSRPRPARNSIVLTNVRDCLPSLSFHTTWEFGRLAEGTVDQSQWLPIEPASINEGLWKIACSQR